jgi:carboxypeptidase C (cathepsin A)
VKPETVPPFRFVDNPDSPLDVADIVLIDPPGTGFSRVLPEGKPEEFFGTAQDAKLTVDLIERWVREYDRWNFPKFLLSESYGTVRSAVVARLIAGGPSGTGSMDGMTLNGIILLGQATDSSNSAGDDGRILNALPTLAATACYQGKAASGCTAAEQVAEARKFASDAYLNALYAGSTLSTAERDAIVTRLAALTGLTPAVIRDNNLRISTNVFAQELLRDQGKQVGIYDGRYTLPLASSGKDPVADDPAMGQYVPGFVIACNMYIRDELGVKIDEEYQAIAFKSVNAKWDYGRGPGASSDINYANDLAIAMRRNPQMRLMIGEGYYDLITTLGSAEYTVAHAGIPLHATEMHLYPSGHMPYLGAESREALAHDVRAFITAGNSANHQ